MEKEEIINILKSFGLSEYESRVYSTLVMLGPSRVGFISKKSSVPQPKMYGILDRLMERQMVETLGGKPKEFRAISPDVALRTLVDHKQEEIGKLKTKLDLLKDTLKPFNVQSEVTDGAWTTKGKGLQDFVNRLAEMYDRSQKYAYLISRDFTQSSRIAQSVKNGIKRGIVFRVIAMKGVDESNFYRAKWFHSQGVEIRIFKTKVHPRIFVIDGKEVLIRLDKNPTKRSGFEFTSIWSADPSLAKVFDSYMKNLWNIAEIVNFKKLEKSLKLEKRPKGENWLDTGNGEEVERGLQAA